jgi:hypothetical protein
MNNSASITSGLIGKFMALRQARVRGHEQLVLQRYRGGTLFIRTGNHADSAIPAIRILRAVEMVRRNPLMYSNEPAISHTTGAGHICDAVWSILHLMTLEQLLE